ncbi:auxin-responsive protein IAA29-like [Carya illinoinensis]|uniref:Auxin-responsive protein n=1 Tax=Carya illinoinensis TaxID=32201 RepID=A0A8T1PHC8_CARIL|nr:auxin-responsive protein IAA29-like [Carya illinoinensis]KAG6643789.1 hypothetical protein CIPAW_08G010800 [Carya illinoinensis]KAG6698237.1 hypothetical protein I3842_08G010800 [Carya illinoinensis]
MDDLQLGLALNPVVHDTPVVKVVTFDLNHDHRELQPVGSEPSNYHACLESQKYAKNKRNSEDAFGKTGDQYMTQTLPLMKLWSGQPNEDDDPKGQKKSCIINKKEEEENHVVGWPPIKPIWVKKQLHQHQGGQIKISDRTAERAGTGPNSLYVKVKMEGVPIARKIDLRLYHSYQMLRDSLITMFAKYYHQQTEKNGASCCYTLTYQDKDGDWLLAGDVPWQSFMESVQRLEIIRNDG